MYLFRLILSAHGPIFFYRRRTIGVEIGSFAPTFGTIKIGSDYLSAIKTGSCAPTLVRH